MKRKHITQIGVNILGFPIYHETTIYQGENNYTGKRNKIRFNPYTSSGSFN